MKGGVCPRCGELEVISKNPESLFFHVLICYKCSEEEINKTKRPWRVHPEMAEHHQKQLGILKF